MTDTGAIIPAGLYKTLPATQFLGIGTLFQVKQSIEWIKCIGPEGHVEIIKPKVADRAKICYNSEEL